MSIEEEGEKIHKNKMGARRKLLSLIPREDLDTIAGEAAQPHFMNRPDLVELICYNWDEDEIRAALNALFHEARDK